MWRMGPIMLICGLWNSLFAESSGKTLLLSWRIELYLQLISKLCTYPCMPVLEKTYRRETKGCLEEQRCRIREFRKLILSQYLLTFFQGPWQYSILVQIDKNFGTTVLTTTYREKKVCIMPLLEDYLSETSCVRSLKNEKNDLFKEKIWKYIHVIAFNLFFLVPGRMRSHIVYLDTMWKLLGRDVYVEMRDTTFFLHLFQKEDNMLHGEGYFKGLVHKGQLIEEECSCSKKRNQITVIISKMLCVQNGL